MSPRIDLVFYTTTLVALLALLALTLRVASGEPAPTHELAEAATASPTHTLDLSPAPQVEAASHTAEEDPVDHGFFHLDAWTSDTAELNLGLRLGGAGGYFFAAGGVDLTHPAGEVDGARYQVGAGFGVRIPIERVFIDLDLAGYALLDSDGSPLEAALGTTRLAVGYRFAHYFAAYAGASANFFFDTSLEGFAEDKIPAAYRDQLPDTSVENPSYIDTRYPVQFEGAPLRMTISPGFYVGIQI